MKKAIKNISAIKELLAKKINSPADLMRAKREVAKKYGIKILRNSDILKKADKNSELYKILRKRAVRTLSGIAPVAVLTKPYPCPGKCVFCPTEKDVPKSYLSNEPAVMRAIRNKYNPYKQVQMRLKALEANGHNPTKIELIVIGGTWSVLPKKYKFWFIASCFKAANEYGGKINDKFQITNQVQNPKFKIQNFYKALLFEQKKNEKAKYKIIGLTLETRPDYVNEKEVLEMRELGCTRVELGVQATDDKILKLNKRGHGAKEISAATKLLKDFGFKITYHIMPGLPGSTAKKDLIMFKSLFKNEKFQPDQIKFYPTVVTKGSLLYEWWKKKKYKPYSDKVLQKLIIDCKKVVPEYVRIIRLIRDIPAESIEAGNIITNLRQIMQDKRVKCRCIRCREAKNKKFSIFNFQFSIIEYKASGGKEYFIQAESKDGKTLYGFCRLRLTAPLIRGGWGVINIFRNEQSPLPPFIKGVKTGGVALIRELHVYGELVPIGGKKKVQHAGLGKMLMAEAEKIARVEGLKKIAVIAGVGVRGYYRKLGYKLENTYMVKEL
jgi:elongator complex protein 3